MTDTYDDFKAEFLKLTDIDLNLYQEKQMKRRIEALIHKLGYDGYISYKEAIEKDKKKLAFFIDYITINVTDFFRTPSDWNYMVDNALQDLYKNKDCIKAWSMASSSGEEPYSLAISVMEKYPDKEIKIYATDIDETILKKAKEGTYSIKQMEKVNEDIKNKYFTFDGSFYHINEDVKRKVSFKKLDLLKYNYHKNYDLILARNVLIYFTKEAKDRIFKEINNSLSIEGYLFTGSTEQIIYYKEYNYIKIRPFLYRKKAVNYEHQ